ncbi:CinA family protein [Eleftheria terrae]|uniref:CinA family protein n=1 Tax=Eleftheria terrae TaxID=1597781 RepID=UPI00263AA510|nr:CinA family protein [Eleftheria terrae]WKB52133.1 CinA family protein [Eleftheria terrae]
MPHPLDDVVGFMKAQELRLVTAESCTAGLIAATLADVPGAGALLESAYVVYSPEAKQRCLGVRPETIEHHNLTSEEVAREMACGALRQSPANVAIANTGVADAVDDDIPAGTQCFAWAFRDENVPDKLRVFSETRRFDGSRNEVRQRSAEYALQRLPFHHGQAAGRAG